MTPGTQNQGALWKERHREEENISRLAEDKEEMKEKPQALRELVVRLSGCKPSEFYVWQGPGAARSPAGAPRTPSTPQATEAAQTQVIFARGASMTMGSRPHTLENSAAQQIL
ncbi:golgin subfamily A member 2-like [Saccopteryx bilineata]|uniref:golgin subfamily A member 2-like n=1 Tax=Saccopteryx bilineata TaxID=59482 RepID=UPI00339053B4